MIHLAIIPDGNRRWAKEHGLDSWKGHEKSAENFEKIVDWSRKSNRISTLTFWIFSTENWNRDPQEVGKLMGLLESYLKKNKEKFLEKGVRMVHSGRKDRLPEGVRTLLEELEQKSAGNNTYTINLALDYSGKDEVIRAVQKLKGEDATDETIRKHLDHPEIPDIDLVIRTSGEHRTSNFALWTAAYAEWIFIDKYFPDLSENDLDAALSEYDQRQRRFGQ